MQELRDRLKINQRKIDLIDTIKQGNRAATSAELSVLDAYERPLAADAIRVMLEAKSLKRAAKRGSDQYQPILIKSDSDFRSLLQLLAGKESKDAFHYDIILQEQHGSGVHCTPAQIHFDGEHLRFFYVDAVGGGSNKAMLEKIVQALNAELYGNKKIGTQTDTFNCSIFSIQDLAVMASLSQEKLVEALRNDSAINPKFLKNSQTQTLVKEWQESHSGDVEAIVSKSKTLAQHVEDFSVGIEIAGNANGQTALKKRNYAIVHKTNKYLVQAIQVLENLIGATDQEKGKSLEALARRRDGKALFDISLFDTLKQKFPKMTELEISRLKSHTYNIKEIILIKEYGAVFSSSEFFVNKQTTNKLFDYITSNFPKADKQSKEDKERLRKIEKSIARCKNSYELAAVLDYGISFQPGQIEHVLRSHKNNLELHEMAIAVIRESFENAVKNHKDPTSQKLARQRAAQAVYERIKIFKECDQILAVVKLEKEYGLILSASKLFTNKKDTDKLLDHIASNFPKVDKQNEEDKKQLKTIASSLGIFKNSYELSAVLDYGISFQLDSRHQEKIIGRGLTNADEKVSKYAMSEIEHAYNKALEDKSEAVDQKAAAKAAAQNIYDKISACENIEQIAAIVKYSHAKSLEVLDNTKYNMEQKVLRATKIDVIGGDVASKHEVEVIGAEPHDASWASCLTTERKGKTRSLGDRE